MVGKTLGHYEILEPLGKGGMGEVYRARDTKLDRDVAIKVLPEDFADDPDRLARFEREAKLLASLNHANIAAIYGLEDEGDQRFIVMEVVEGQTLEQRLMKGAIPVPEALDIARQIAEALEAAHDEGIIHRDVKPANVLLTAKGGVKVLDFGIAKNTVLDTGVAATAQATSLTMNGTLMGTPPYMSPEQIRGEQADKRADIWAFGCVLYETLVGRRAFDRGSIADTLAAIIEAEPDWGALPTTTPALVVALLRRCLRKEPDRRLHDIADARIEIEDSSGEDHGPLSPEEDVAVAASSRRNRLRLGIEVAVIVAVAAGVWLMSRTTGPTAPAPGPHSSEMAMPDGRRLAFRQVGDQFALIAISPNGRVLAFSGTEREMLDDPSHGPVTGGSLYVRHLSELGARPVPESEGAISPFFSPDGSWLAFAAGGKLKKVPVSGGAVVELADGIGGGGAWAPDDRIVYTPKIPGSGLWIVSAEGADAAPLTELDAAAGEGEHRWPQVLPDGHSILFTVWLGGSYDDAAIAITDIDDGAHRIVYTGGSMGRYVPTGHLVFARAGELLALPFDLETERVTGTPTRVAEGVLSDPMFHAPQFDVAAAGTLIYAPGGVPNADRELVWVDRSGQSMPIKAEKLPYREVSLSPDDDAIAYTVSGRTFSAWELDLTRGGTTLLTPDGVYIRHVAFGPTRNSVFLTQMDRSVYDLQVIRRDAIAAPERWLDSEVSYRGFASSSPVGSVAFLVRNEGTAQVWIRSEPGAEPRPLTGSSGREGRPDLSRDGRWIAYESTNAGNTEIHASRLDGGSAPTVISTGGGRWPLWAPDGKELYYRNGTLLMAVPVDTSGDQLGAGVPYAVFDEPALEVADVAADGRFLAMRRPEMAPAPASLIVISNWFEELKRLVPTGGSR